jgi:hypothetical protein
MDAVVGQGAFMTVDPRRVVLLDPQTGGQHEQTSSR